MQVEILDKERRDLSAYEIAGEELGSLDACHAFGGNSTASAVLPGLARNRQSGSHKASFHCPCVSDRLTADVRTL